METTPLTAPDSIKRSKLAGWALGAVPMTFMAGIFSLFYIEFFYKDLKLFWPLIIVGLVIYGFINALNDPLLGQLSDRTNASRWGSRRIIYIKYGGPIWALAFISIWFPWSYWNHIIMFIHFVVSICAYDLMLTLVVMCWMALLPEMTSSVDERNKANFWVGVVVVFSIIPILIVVLLKAAGIFVFQMVNIVIGIISTICLLIVARTAKERPESQRSEVFPLSKSVKEVLKRKSFLYYVGYNFCMVFNGSITLSFFFAYMLILGGFNPFNILAFFTIYAGVGFLSNRICIKLRPKWGMRKLILRFGILRIIGTFVVFFFIINPITEPLIWFALIWTTFFGGAGVFTIPLMYVSMDEDELKHGTRREGMFLGMNALFTKPAESFGPIIGILFLTMFGYVPDAPTQTGFALFGIKLLFLMVPVIATSISLIFMYFYPFDVEKMKDLAAKLKELHKQKREKLKEAVS